MRSVRVLAALIAFVGGTATAAPSAVVTLHVNPDHVLMGLPAMLEITIANHGTEAIALTGQARMTASDPSGKSFVATGKQESPGIGVFALPDDANLTIPPGVTREFVWRTFEFSNDPIFFNDPHFRTPGSFLLRLEILTANRDVSFVSNDTTLTVEEPHGVDATVWGLMVAAGGLRNPIGLALPTVAEKLASAVLANYADSQYGPYFAPFLMRDSSSSVHERAVRWALTKPVGGAFAGELSLVLLEMYAASVGNEIHSFDLEAALAYQTRAQELAGELRESKLSFVADRAKAILELLPSRDQVNLQYQARIHDLPPATESVVPFVQCVDPGVKAEDDQVVVFGFRNPNQFGTYIPHGDRNRLQPDQDDVSPPVYFAGTQKNAMTVVERSAHTVTWTLDSHSVAATDKSDRCVPPSTPSPLMLLIDCVQGDDNRIGATFGYLNNNAAAIRVPLGALNAASGESVPPTVFLPGEHHGVLIVTSRHGESPSWTLQGTTLTASPSGIPCESDDHGEH